MRDGVVVPRLTSIMKQPVPVTPIDLGVSDEVAEHPEHTIGQVHNMLRSVLGRCHRYCSTVPLQLPSDRELTPHEVDVTKLNARGLAAAQPSEGTQGDEGHERLVGRAKQTTDRFDIRDPHGGLALAGTAQNHSGARVARDGTVGDGGSKYGPNDGEPSADRRRRESQAHLLHP